MCMCLHNYVCMHVMKYLAAAVAPSVLHLVHARVLYNVMNTCTHQVRHSSNEAFKLCPDWAWEVDPLSNLGSSVSPNHVGYIPQAPSQVFKRLGRSLGGCANAVSTQSPPYIRWQICHILYNKLGRWQQGSSNYITYILGCMLERFTAI